MDLHNEARILIVDDIPSNLLLLEKILRNDGYRHIDCLSDPTQVVEQYKTNDYDLLLLDIHMPKMNGFDVMYQLAQLNKEDYLPVLVVTADLTKETRHLCLAAGAKDFVSKPFDRFEVLMRVRNILEVRLLHRHLQEYSDTLERKVRERTEQLYQAQVKVIQCLGKAAEYRDNETGMHVVRMSRASALLANAMGLSVDECELILQASPMHDIGKIAVPDKVLLKPGKLKGEEWSTMQNHAEIGAEILGRYETKLMDMASIIAGTHHEKWNGSGYPKGLKGEEIPLYTRIVSVCDVFDALTSRRPYKEAWPTEEALDYLREQSGSHFDPEVVTCFMAIVEEVEALRTKYPDDFSMDLPGHGGSASDKPSH